MKILTVEDPVEYQMAGINQIQVKPQIDLTFANALRSIVRQDPDVIMIGEIRDLETAQIAVQSALTGHLVLSTVHTNDAASTVNRLLDMGVEDYLLTSTVIGILAQRLVRTLCPHCKEPYTALPEIVEQLGLARFTDAKDITLYHPKGCAQCAQTGYTGRISILEMLPMTDPLRSLVMKHATATELRNEAIARRHADDVRGRPAQGGARRSRRSRKCCASRARAERMRRDRAHARRPTEATNAVYRYKAVNAAGDVAVGELDAANESEIVDRLRDQGLMPMQVARATGARRRRAARRAAREPRRAAALVRVEDASRATSCSRSRASSRRCCAPGCRSTARSRS